MAIKIKKTKERMKELFPNLNLSNAKLNAIVVKISKQIPEDADDDAIDSAITDLDDVVSFEKVVKESDKLSKLEKAAKSKKANKGTEVDDDDEPNEDDSPEEIARKAAVQAAKDAKKSGGEVPAYVQEMLKKMNDLTDEVKSIKEGKVIDQKKTSARALFEKSEVLKGLPKKRQDRLFKTLDIDDEDITIEEQIQELEEEEAEFVQKAADSTDLAGPAPTATIDDKKATDAELDAIVGK